MTTTTEIHAAIAQMQILMTQAADRITHFADELAKSHTLDGIVKDLDVQLMLESDADLVDHLRAAALPWDQRQKPSSECLCKDKCLHKGTMGQCKGLPSVLVERVREPDAIVTSLTSLPDGVPRSGLDRELPLMAGVYLAPQATPAQQLVALDPVGMQKILVQSGCDIARSEERAAFLSGVRRHEAVALDAAQPVQQEPMGNVWQMFAAYLIDKCEGETISEELLQRSMSDMLADLKYAGQQPAPRLDCTYTSTQATNCAGCGKHKHTPLRIDKMGGYVCLTCIDKKLGSLLGEFGHPPPEGWRGDIQKVIDSLEPEDWCGDESMIAALTRALRSGHQEVEPKPSAWYESVAELAAVYGEMCAINETKRDDQTPEQTARLAQLRAECVAIHKKRIGMLQRLKPGCNRSLPSP